MTAPISDLFFVEEMELRFIQEAIEHRKRREENPSTYKYRLNHFEVFMRKTLLNELTKKTIFRMKSLSNSDIQEYLTASLAQFTSHRPWARLENIKAMFWTQFWHPKTPPTVSIDMNKEYYMYFMHSYRGYERYFRDYKEAIELIAQDFENGFLETAESQQPSDAPKFKLNTNLTVAELAYLFRVLYEKGIIESKNKTDICRFVCENFSSKQKDTIQEKSLYNRFNNPEYNAIDHWQEIFYQLGEKARQDKKSK